MGLGHFIVAVGADDNGLGLIVFELIDRGAGGDAGWSVGSRRFGSYTVGRRKRRRISECSYFL